MGKGNEFGRQAGRFVGRLFSGLFTMPCLFHTMTGLYCPGCGGTRAVKFFLEGNWPMSFRYHPLVLYGVLAVGLEGLSFLAARISNNRRWYLGHEKELLYVAVGIVAVNFLVKNSLLIFWRIDLLGDL